MHLKETVTIDPHPRIQLESAERELAAVFAGVYSPETVERCLAESADRLLVTARVTGFVPLLAYRFTRERLRAAAHAEGKLVKTVPEVHFVCVHNAGRSQMAAALLDCHAAGRVHVRSAGSAPASEINPAVVAAGRTRPRPHPRVPQAPHRRRCPGSGVVITMGCGDACPIYPGKRYLDWELDDPAGQSVEAVRRIRDDIDHRVRTLLKELTGDD